MITFDGPVTDWFPSNIKPIYTGWYQIVDIFQSKSFRWWSGDYWYFDDTELIKAMTLNQHYTWRGLK
jgi:hypothetical protein